MKRWLDYYVLGKYHCDTCPYSWEERSYEGDADAGCYIFGDLRDSCRLMPPLRALIGWPRRKKALYVQAHEYDGFGEFWERDFANQEKFNELFFEAIGEYQMAYLGVGDEWIPFDPKDEEFFRQRLRAFRFGYEDTAHPFVYKSLKQEWRELIARTWREFLGIFKPYFCK